MFGVLCSVFCLPQARAATLRDVRHVSSPDTTRLIVELSEPVRYRVQIAEARPSAGVPARVYVDLVGVRLDDAARLSSRLTEGPLRRVNATARGAEATRLILDVPGLREWSAFPMADPFRLVIDLHGAPRPGVRRPAVAGTLQQASRGAGRRVGPQPSTVRPASVPGETRSPAADNAEAARLASTVPLTARSAPPAVSRRRVKIVIDPGHGGKDPGASGVSGVAEKDVTLAIALRLAVRLRVDPHVEVVLTRSTDVFLTLQERTARANSEGADLFVSIHANASPNSKLEGVETYYLNNTNDRATLRLAGMENDWRASSGAGVRPADVSLILSDLVQNYKIQESVALAGSVQDSLVAELAAAGTPSNDLGVKQGPFYVLVGAAMPCVLVEVSFLTHPVEGKLLERASYQEAIAAGVWRGLQRFVEKTQVAENL